MQEGRVRKEWGSACALGGPNIKSLFSRLLLYSCNLPLRPVHVQIRCRHPADASPRPCSIAIATTVLKPAPNLGIWLDYHLQRCTVIILYLDALYLVGGYTPEKTRSILWHAAASSVSVAGIQISAHANPSAPPSLPHCPQGRQVRVRGRESRCHRRRQHGPAPRQAQLGCRSKGAQRRAGRRPRRRLPRRAVHRVQSRCPRHRRQHRAARVAGRADH